MSGTKPRGRDLVVLDFLPVLLDVLDVTRFAKYPAVGVGGVA